MIDAPEISAKLIRKMESRGLNQVAVAKLTGLSQSQISRFCAGKFRRNSRNLQKLCQALGVTPATSPHSERQLMQSFQQLLRAKPEKMKTMQRLMDTLNDLLTPRAM
jgi:transcriptional regulator with XRE-family HTH domain